MDVLYFACCFNSYDPKLIRVAKATARIMEKAGISFGILVTNRLLRREYS